jgi:hypothetical protein
MITFDCRLQYGLRCAKCLAFALQTTAYHLEANGAVERLHHCLKGTLRAQATVANWAEEISWVLLDFRSNPAQAIYSVALVLPNELLQVKEFSVDQIFNKFSKIIDTPAFSLPSKNNFGQQLPN